jgi:hypothetical protein
MAGRVKRSGQDAQPVFFHHGQEFQRRAAWPFCAGLPFLNRGRGDIEAACECWLAYFSFLTERLNVLGFELRRDGKAGFVKMKHRGLVNRAYSIHSLNRAMYRFKGIAFEFFLVDMTNLHDLFAFQFGLHL